MKFVVRNVQNGCRLGHVTELARHPEVTLYTPGCMLYTRTGSAPHLTKDMLNRIEGGQKMALISAAHFIDHKKALAAFEQGVAKFSNMEDYVVVSSMSDAASELPSGFNDKNTISMWTRGGKVKVDPQQYMDLQEALQPDFYEVMTDVDVNENSSNKRLQKALSRTVDWLDQCVERHAKSQKLKDSCMLGVVTGGYSVEQRCKMAAELMERPLSGFVIDGFHSGGVQAEKFHMAAIRDVMVSLKDRLPNEKPRFMKGAMRPDQVLEAVEMGVDIFDSSYCYLATERGSALNFNFDYHSYDKERQIEMTSSAATTSERPFEIIIKGTSYFDDFSPLVDGCSCYTCRQHTRSYVAHLLNTNELLANVLLVIHNFHHFFRFFFTIRRALEEEKFDVLKSQIMSQRR